MRAQKLVTMLMVYAAYIAAKCPCEKTLSCHLPQFYSSVAFASFLVARENALQ
jgi:hypothetical protein